MKLKRVFFFFFFFFFCKCRFTVLVLSVKSGRIKAAKTTLQLGVWSHLWNRPFLLVDKGLSKETVLLRRWGVEKTVWFVNRVDN